MIIPESTILESLSNDRMNKKTRNQQRDSLSWWALMANMSINQHSFWL